MFSVQECVCIYIIILQCSSYFLILLFFCFRYKYGTQAGSPSFILSFFFCVRQKKGDTYKYSVQREILVLRVIIIYIYIAGKKIERKKSERPAVGEKGGPVQFGCLVPRTIFSSTKYQVVHSIYYSRMVCMQHI